MFQKTHGPTYTCYNVTYPSCNVNSFTNSHLLNCDTDIQANSYRVAQKVTYYKLIKDTHTPNTQTVTLTYLGSLAPYRL